MTRSPSLLKLGLVVGAAALIPACVGDTPPEPTDKVETRFIKAVEPIHNSYIVVLSDEVGTQLRRGQVGIQTIAAQLSADYGADVDRTYEHALHGFSAQMTEDDALALADDPRVAYVQENGVVHLSATQNNATWGIDRIDQASRPLSTTYTYPNTGSGVTAYVIDTGIRTTHSNFGGRASSGFSAIDDGNGTNDCQGHGTHVAGTIGSTTYGVAKGVNLVAVRVLDCSGSGDDAGVIAGIDWVTEHHSGPSVANMSLGGDASDALDQALENSIASGVTHVVAAGNESQNACNVSPARVGPAITVGATTSGDAKASYSNFGTCVDIMAPGSSITSTSNASNSSTTTMSGTSMASPHVAGAAALYLSANPSASPSQVRDALVNNATTGKLSSLNGAPNKLLFVGFIGDGGGGGGGGGGVPKTSTESGSLTKNQQVDFAAMTVVPGTTLTATMTGGNDPDLYVRFGSKPTTTAYDCRPYTSGASETCSLVVPAGTTTAYVSVRGYSSTSTYTVKTDWTAPQ